LDAPIQKINLHLRGGFIIPMQTPGTNLILGRANPFQLLVALSSSGNATGNLYWDDGESIGTFPSIYLLLFSFDNLDSIGTKTYNYLQFTLTSKVSSSIKYFLYNVDLEYTNNECSCGQL